MGKQVNKRIDRFFSSLVFLALLSCVFVPAAEGTVNPREALKEYVAELRGNPDDPALREKIIKLALTINPPPAIPEEARRPFVKANTALKEAKRPDDYDRAIQQYNETLLIAPWWAEAYFNQAKALELRQRYDDAIKSLKLYLLAAPQAEDTRAAQDKIYELEDKKARVAQQWTREVRQKKLFAEKLKSRWYLECTIPGRSFIYEIEVDESKIKVWQINLCAEEDDHYLKYEGALEGRAFVGNRYDYMGCPGDPDPPPSPFENKNSGFWKMVEERRINNVHCMTEQIEDVLRLSDDGSSLIGLFATPKWQARKSP